MGVIGETKGLSRVAAVSVKKTAAVALATLRPAPANTLLPAVTSAPNIHRQRVQRSCPTKPECVSRSLKKLEKYGSLKYLAQWQGLRGEDLDIDLTVEKALTCSRTKMVVTFTPDRTKYFNQMAEAEAQS
ncbi:hypothetical protein [Pseudomonas prosekii]|uniref:Uncharacterized protein n=1 Tax=Pseudomonas prosekii TaxID=1148509 RepID=A0A1H2AU32_9PSED|nr:hypothetical protein [Pseudomonas prosekii]SDT49312.1 hypothetical protein SAMN05216222_4686 [Pseudomonas prosekii]